MDGRMPPQFGNVEDCVRQALSRVGRRIVLCAPIGAGKPVALVNAFYHRAAADPGIELAILTGLTLDAAELRANSSGGWSSRSPRASSATRRNPPGPGRCAPGSCRPTSACRNSSWSRAPGSTPRSRSSPTRASTTPTSRAACSRRARTSSHSRSRAARAAASSLGTNPDVTADLIPMLRERERAGQPVAVIGQVNDRMPFMFGAAEMAESALRLRRGRPARLPRARSRRRTARSRPRSMRSRSRRACWCATAARSRSASASSAMRSCTR